MGHLAIPMNENRKGFSQAQLSVIANDIRSIVNVHVRHISQNNRMCVLSRGLYRMNEGHRNSNDQCTVIDYDKHAND